MNEKIHPEAGPDDGRTAQPATPPAAELLETHIGSILHPVIVGIAATIPAVRPEVILLSCCRVLAKLIGMMYVGNEDAVTKFRNACRVNFASALHAEPIRAIPRPTTAQPAQPPVPEQPAEAIETAADAPAN